MNKQTECLCEMEYQKYFKKIVCFSLTIKVYCETKHKFDTYMLLRVAWEGGWVTEEEGFLGSSQTQVCCRGKSVPSSLLCYVGSLKLHVH